MFGHEKCKREVPFQANFETLDCFRSRAKRGGNDFLGCAPAAMARRRLGVPRERACDVQRLETAALIESLRVSKKVLPYPPFDDRTDVRLSEA